MSNKKRIGLCLAFGLGLALLGLLRGSNAVYARGIVEIQKSFVDKSIYQGVYKCYVNGYVRPNMELKDYHGIGSLLTDHANDNENYVPLISGSRGTGMSAIFVDPKTRYEVEDSGLSCEQLFVGGDYVFGGSNKGLLEATGTDVPSESNTEEVRDFMRGMGYTVKTDSSVPCYAVKYSTDKLSNKVCQNADGTLYVEGSLPDKAALKLEINKKNELCLKLYSEMDDLPGYWPVMGGNRGCGKIETFNGEGILGTITNICGRTGNEVRCVADDGKMASVVIDTTTNATSEQDSINNDVANFIDNDSKKAAFTAIKYLSETDYDLKSIKIDGPEKRILYQAYLESFYNVTVSCNDNQVDSTWTGKLAWYDSASNSMKECHYDTSIAKRKGDPVNGVESNGFLKYESIKNMEKLIEAIKALPTSYSEDELGELEEVSSGRMEGEDEDDEEGVCYKNSGSLGWIICPVIQGISRVGTAAWEFVEENFLQIRAAELFEESGGLEGVWQRFRDIANILFIILFLFVIFSQLTGVGIDNYGIKKIMPRLIVVAILVNLSFLICALAVDISNILGSGLNSMFSSMAGEIPEAIMDLQSTEASGGSIAAVVGIGVGGTVLFGILNPVGALSLGGVMLGIGLAVLGIMLAIVFSILFMLIILIIRNAGIVILIAISPVAIVCYMLPNTEKLYKKWYELFKALLIVYPICGAMIGAGRLAGNMIASIDSPGMRVAGMVMNVLPFFLVPMLLKQSLRLMGNIGATLSSVGKNLGRKTSASARNRIVNSERVKDWSQIAQERRMGQRATRISQKLRSRATGADGQLHLERLSEMERLKLQKADATSNSWIQKSAQAKEGSFVLDSETAERRARSSLGAQELKMYQEQFAGYSQDQLRAEASNAADWLGRPGGSGSQRMSALLQAMESNGMERDMATLLSRNNVSGYSNVLQTLAGSKNAVFSAYGKRASKDGNNVGFNTFMTGGANAANGQSMAAYLNEKGGDAIAKLDDKSLGTIADYQSQLNAAAQQNGTPANAEQILSTDQLVSAAAQMKAEDSLRYVNSMLSNRDDIKMSGSQLANMNVSTLQTLSNMQRGIEAVVNASDDIAARDPKIIPNISSPVLEKINAIRAGEGRPNL